LITASNITIQFGAKPLFENVSLRFGNGNRYGLIGANGSGKSTFMKILSGEIQPSAGNVNVDADERVGILRQNQFAFEDFTAIDTVIMGHDKLWKIKEEKDAIYNLPEMSEDDGMRVAELEIEFAELDGYSAEANAGELLLGLGIPLEQHYGPMSAIAPGWKFACCWRKPCSPIRTSCCWTNRPTTSTSTRSAGWKASSISATAP